MLKQRILEIVLWSFLASYLTAMLFIFSSEQQSGNHDKTKGYEIENKSFWQKLFPDSISFFNFSLVLVTGGLFVIGIIQANAAKIAADAAKRSADSDRPHMLPVQFKISGMRGPVRDDGKIKGLCEFRFINYGRSPAFMKTCCFQDHIGHELPAIPHYGESIKISQIITVNGWFGSVEGEVSTPIAVSIPASDVADILIGRNNYFIFGYIEYDDVASQNHKMRFAYSFDWGPGDASERFHPDGPDSYREYT